MKKDWEVIQRETGYDGFLKLTRYQIRHRLFGGGWSKTLNREVLERLHAAAVIPYDAALDSTLLIEQFRVGALEHEQGPWLQEYIAGGIETGESGEEVVRREAMEEAGITLNEVHYISSYYPSPGGSSETIALYWAEADLSSAGGVFGLPTEGEDIRASVVKFDDVLARVDNGSIDNSLTMLLTLWFQRNCREKLLLI